MEKILLTTMLTIKILFTINSLEKKKKTIHSKHYSQFLSINNNNHNNTNNNTNNNNNNSSSNNNNKMEKQSQLSQQFNDYLQLQLQCHSKLFSCFQASLCYRKTYEEI